MTEATYREVHPSGFITMNSYNKPRSMSNKGMRKQAIPAPKLMAIENEFHRTKDALVWEVKRLRGEVGVLAKRYNNARREIEDLVKRVRSQPPPPIPKRDEETEKKIEERRNKWREHLQKESEEEERKQAEEEESEEEEKESEEEEEENDDTDMSDAQPPTNENNADNNLSPEQSPLDQSPQTSQDKESDTPMPDSTVKSPLENGSDQVETVAKEKEKEAEKVSLKVGNEWVERNRKLSMEERYKRLSEGAKNWAHGMEMTGREDEKVDVKWLRTQAVKVLGERRVQNLGTKLSLIDAWSYGWIYGGMKLTMTKDTIVVREEP